MEAIPYTTVMHISYLLPVITNDVRYIQYGLGGL